MRTAVSSMNFGNATQLLEKKRRAALPGLLCCNCTCAVHRPETKRDESKSDHDEKSGLDAHVPSVSDIGYCLSHLFLRLLRRELPEAHTALLVVLEHIEARASGR